MKVVTGFAGDLRVKTGMVLMFPKPKIPDSSVYIAKPLP
jgi:hypothetical protein